MDFIVNDLKDSFRYNGIIKHRGYDLSFYKNRIYFKTKKYTCLELKKLFENKKLDYLELILLFGSRATDRFHDKSDYDFAVYTSQELNNPWGNMAQIWNDFGDILDLHECDYDVIDLAHTPKNMIESIRENYIILKGSEDEIQRLFDKYN